MLPYRWRLSLVFGSSICLSLACAGTFGPPPVRNTFTSADAFVTFRKGQTGEWFADDLRVKKRRTPQVDIDGDTLHVFKISGIESSSRSITLCGKGGLKSEGLDRLAVCVEVDSGCHSKVVLSEPSDFLSSKKPQLPVPTSRQNVVQRLNGQWMTWEDATWKNLDFDPVPSTLNETDSHWVGQIGNTIHVWDRNANIVDTLTEEDVYLRPAPVGDQILVSTPNRLLLWTPGEEPTQVVTPIQVKAKSEFERFSLGAWRGDAQAIMVYSNREGVWRAPLMASPRWDDYPYAIDIQNGTFELVNAEHNHYDKELRWLPFDAVACLFRE